MLAKLASLIFYICFLINFQENFAWNWQIPPSACDVFSSKSNVSYPTPSPINVDPEKTIKIHTNSSLILKNGILIPLTVYNSGYALEVHGFAFEYKTAQTFGGVACGRIYIFFKVVFYVSDDPKLSSFTQINGKGSPLTLSLIYINKECRSFNECLHRRDGLIIQNYQIGFSPIDNPLFYPVELLINFLRKPGSRFTVPAALVYAWFDRLPLLFGYYANYGSYIDLKTGKQYPCAIEVVADRTVYVISERQFYNSFSNLLNEEGKPLINRQPISELNGRRIYRATGLEGIFTLF